MCLVDLLRPRTLVELGTHYGDSYCAFCQAVLELNLNTRCYAIDTWEGEPHSGLYGPEVLANLREHHDSLYGSFSSLVKTTFDDALAYFPDGAIDLLHIDGYHTYEVVKHDFESWLPKMSVRGVVLFHDINVRERDFGVWKLWEELQQQYLHFEFVHGYGLGLLAVGKDFPIVFQEFLEASLEDGANIRKFFSQLGQRLTLEVQHGKHHQASVEKEHQLTQLAAERGQLAQEAIQLRGTLQRHEQALAEKEDRLRQVAAERGQLAQEAIQLRDTVQRHEQALADKGHQLTQLAAERGQLAQEAAQLQVIVQRQEQALSVKEQLAAERDQLTQELTVFRAKVHGQQGTILKQEEEISRLLADKVRGFREKDQEISQAVHERELLSQKIASIKLRVAGLQAAMQTQRELLFAIRDSLGWMLLVIYRRLRDTLFPDGTQRRRAYNAIKDFFKSLVGRIKTQAVSYDPLETKALTSYQGMLDSELVTSNATLDFRDRFLGQIFDRSAGRSRDYVPIAKEDWAAGDTNVKLIAFYLPQFYPIPENDEWWGKGFTEWSHVGRATSQFVSHYQPRLPGELGFYDLRLIEVQRRQIELAKKYGIYGFCFHYYWFSGKHLLDVPLKRFLENPDLDLPFCLCWANENWTRRWDGLDNEVLIAQTHSPDDDLAFIKDIEPALRDKRYIRVNGRPALIVYRPALLPDPQQTARIWRDYCKNSLNGLYLVAVQAFGTDDPRPLGFDAAVEFPPHKLGRGAPLLNSELEIGNPDYQGFIYDYAYLMESAKAIPSPDFTLFRGVCPSWDNEARTPGKGTTYTNSTPALYEEWLTQVARSAAREPDPDKRLVFINAWNEWSEGAYLEPDRRYGYAYLQATANALRKCAKFKNQDALGIVFVSHDAANSGAQRILINLIEWLRDNRGVRPRIVLRRGGSLAPEFRRLGSVLEMDSSLGSNWERTKEELISFCSESNSLIYVNTLVPGDVAKKLSELKLPIITHVHELEHAIERWCVREDIQALLELTDHFIAASPPVARNLENTHGVTPTKITTIYEFIKCQQDNVFDKGAIKRERQFSEEGFIILGCGTTDWRKGPDLFVEVAAETKRLGLEGGYFFWIGADTGELQTLEARVRKLGLEDRVRFLGEVQDARSYFSAGDLFLLTSREDPFPLVCLEAADAGLPIVCFDQAGGMPDFVENDAGYVVPFEDTKAMAEKVIFLYRNPEERARRGAMACHKVRARHDMSIAGGQIFRIIDQYSVRQNSQRNAERRSVPRQATRSEPKLSVIVPNYNHAPYLRQRLDSIIRQDFQDLEVIVLDDASTDSSKEIMQAYARYPQFRFLLNEARSGSAFKQWKKGLEEARGEYIWFAESDDYASSHFLSKLLPILESDKFIGLVYCQSYLVDLENKILGDALQWTDDLDPRRWRGDFVNDGKAEIRSYLSKKNTIPNASAVLIRASTLKSIDHLDDTYGLCGDWLLWIKLLLRSNIGYVAEKLNYWRQYSSNSRPHRPGIAEWEEGQQVLRYVAEELGLSEEERHKLLLSFLERCFEWVTNHGPGLSPKLISDKFSPGGASADR
jgi:glycosyltransferase involved in cell wall biosynthesis